MPSSTFAVTVIARSPERQVSSASFVNGDACDPEGLVTGEAELVGIVTVEELQAACPYRPG